MQHSCAACGKVLMLGQPAALNGSVDKKFQELVNKMHSTLSALFVTIKKQYSPLFNKLIEDIQEVKIIAGNSYYVTQTLKEAFKNAVEKFAGRSQVTFKDSALDIDARTIHGDAEYARIVMTADISDKNILIQLIESHARDPGDDWVHIRMFSIPEKEK
jgi:hypothetical protein